MRLNTKQCLLCGELHGANLRLRGFEICADCERRLLFGKLRTSEIQGLRRLSTKLYWFA